MLTTKLEEVMLDLKAEKVQNQMDKLVVSFAISCYKFFRDHFLLAIPIFLLAFLYRAFPLLFRLFLRACPVLIGTAVLLGFLLSYGELELSASREHVIVEGEDEEVRESEGEIVNLEASFVRASASGDSVSVVRSGNTFISRKIDLADDFMDEKSDSWKDDFREYVPLISENCHEGKGTIEDNEFIHVDSLKKEVHSSREFNDLDDNLVEDVDTKEDSDSESTRGENSSPDASMENVISSLDELHPLLVKDSMHHTGGPSKILDDEVNSSESDESTEDQGDEEDDINEENEEEAIEEEKEDESNSAIKWTADDEKSIMDLGYLELERNQRLETLLMRRRARSYVRSMAERNLIDLDGTEPSASIPSISTRRQNPFDLPFDLMDYVPGSAPSILLPRKNPFDIPYSSSKEDSAIDGEEQAASAVFSRHASFNVGSSLWEFPRQPMHEIPYIVPENYSEEENELNASLSIDNEKKYSEMQKELDEKQQSSTPQSYHDSEEVCSEEYPSILVKHGSISSEDADTNGAEFSILKQTPQDEDGAQHHRERFSVSSVSDDDEPPEKKESNEGSSSVSVTSSQSDSEKESPQLDSNSESIYQEAEESIEQSRPDASQKSPSEVHAHCFDENSISHEQENNVDGQQNKDPVYDSSPSSSDQILSFISDTRSSCEEAAEASLTAQLQPRDTSTGEHKDLNTHTL